MSPVLASHGSEEFNRSLWQSVVKIDADVRQAMGKDLIALILGGGYGRGEGGVWVDKEGCERPYNDFDFTLVVQHFPRGMETILREIGHRHGEKLGMEVDFSRPLTVAALRKLPHWMLWHDLLQGHLVVSGPADVLTANMPSTLLATLPQTEGLRLLLNRGAGLLWARRIALGIDPEPDPDFRRRNVQKANLSLGDAILVSFGRYTAQCRGRDLALAELAGQSASASQARVLDRYRTALGFKFNPASVPSDQPGLEQLQEAAALWLQVLLETESRRTGRAFADAQSYAQWDGIREAALHGGFGFAANAARNARLGVCSLRHPRESLHRELPLLLAPGAQDSPDWRARTDNFLARWRQFN